MIWAFVLIAVLIGVNAFFAAAEIAIVSASRIRLRRLAEEGNRRAAEALRLATEPGRFLATVQVGVTIAGFAASAVGAVTAAALLAEALRGVSVPFIADRADGIAVAVVTVLIAFLSLVFGELAPKNLAIGSPDSTALGVAYPVSFLAKLFSPVVWLLNGTTNLILGGQVRVKLPSVTPEEIVAIADVAEEEGAIDERERMILEGALTLGDRKVGELVVPRVDVRALPTEATLAEARDLIVKTGHSRVPIYRGTIDEIVGVLHTKDLLAALPTDRPGLADNVEKIMRAALFVPEMARADDVLRDMQRQRMHLAVVVDEYGGTAGIVTLENLLEELVGPIRDEYDAAEQPEIRRVSEDEIIVSGDADLDDVAEVLDVQIDHETVDTIAGLIYSELGRIPVPGDQVAVPGLRAEVLRMRRNRVSLVRLTRSGGTSGGPGNP